MCKDKLLTFRYESIEKGSYLKNTINFFYNSTVRDYLIFFILKGIILVILQCLLICYLTLSILIFFKNINNFCIIFSINEFH